MERKQKNKNNNKTNKNTCTSYYFSVAFWSLVFACCKYLLTSEWNKPLRNYFVAFVFICTSPEIVLWEKKKSFKTSKICQDICSAYTSDQNVLKNKNLITVIKIRLCPPMITGCL